MAGCTTCGQPLRPDAYWCEFCGTRVAASNDRVSVESTASTAIAEAAPAPAVHPPRARPRRSRRTPLPPPLHPPRRVPRLRTTATGVFGWIVIAVIAVALVGGAINTARQSDESETSFDIPDATVQTVAYESPSGLYSIDFPIAADGDTPIERSEPVELTASTGSLPTNIAETNALGVANYEVQEVALRENHPPAAQLASDRCKDNDQSAVLTELRVADRRAWHCQWTVSNGFSGDEVFLTVGETALLLRGSELPAAFEALGYDSPFNAMVNSLRILRPD